MIKALLALTALGPLMVGPVPQEDAVLVVSLCSGGEITIPLGDEDERPARDCDPQACHAGTCRQKGKKGDLI